MEPQQVIFIELRNVDVTAIQDDRDGQVIGVRIGLSVDRAEHLLDELAAELHPWRFQAQRLRNARRPDQWLN